MRTILVTGANKGIGLATVRAILDAHDDVNVLLGSRDAARGEAAAASLNAADRVRVLSLDVTSSASVDAAAAQVETLDGLVNNAGIMAADLATVLDVNIGGPKRVCDAFLPKLSKGGRVANVSSASGPNYIAAAPAELRRTLTNPAVTWADIQGVIDARLAAGESNPYGLSKALLNAYTLLLARERPDLGINACTPGFIETDLTRPWAEGRGVSPASMGMKTPAEGTRATMHLLFGEVGQGWYYGSDAQRSPLDRYRSPGDPAYTGD